MGLFQRFTLWIERIILTKFVPYKNPGAVFKWIFKLPIYMYRIGLGSLIDKRILILTTIGRKTGIQRKTALEYDFDEAANTYTVMAGWGGYTDWYRNSIANPNVRVQVGKKAFNAVAEKLTAEEVTQILIEITRINPDFVKIWSRWSDDPIDCSVESLRKAAKHFPTLRLKPVNSKA